MPTLLPVIADPIMEIVVKGTVSPGGSSQTPCGNVFFYRRVTNGSSVTKAALSTIFQSTVLVPLLAAANAAYSPNTLRMRFLSDATDPATDIAAAGVGAIATDSEPSLDAVVCLLKTTLRGKNARGFKHFGGTSEVDTTRDVLTGAGLARWQAVRDALSVQLNDALGNVWAPFLFSRPGSQWRVNPTVIRGANINTAVLDLVIGSMRKRKPKLVR